MPCPPVLHWRYEIKEPNGNVVEIGHGKANSYTRNTLNILGSNLGLPEDSIFDSSHFSDGYISIKNTSGTVVTSSTIMSTHREYVALYVGTGTATESLDSYSFVSPVSMGSTIKVSTWDSVSRKLITSINNTYQNSSGSAVDIKESGITDRCYSGPSTYSTYLLIYDTFDAISVANGQTLSWTYSTEVAYPNP